MNPANVPETKQTARLSVLQEDLAQTNVALAKRKRFEAEKQQVEADIAVRRQALLAAVNSDKSDIAFTEDDFHSVIQDGLTAIQLAEKLGKTKFAAKAKEIITKAQQARIERWRKELKETSGEQLFQNILRVIYSLDEKDKEHGKAFIEFFAGKDKSAQEARNKLYSFTGHGMYGDLLTIEEDKRAIKIVIIVSVFRTIFAGDYTIDGNYRRCDSINHCFTVERLLHFDKGTVALDKLTLKDIHHVINLDDDVFLKIIIKSCIEYKKTDLLTQRDGLFGGKTLAQIAFSGNKLRCFMALAENSSSRQSCLDTLKHALENWKAEDRRSLETLVIAGKVQIFVKGADVEVCLGNEKSYFHVKHEIHFQQCNDLKRLAEFIPKQATLSSSQDRKDPAPVQPRAVIKKLFGQRGSLLQMENRLAQINQELRDVPSEDELRKQHSQLLEKIAAADAKKAELYRLIRDRQLTEYKGTSLTWDEIGDWKDDQDCDPIQYAIEQNHAETLRMLVKCLGDGAKTPLTQYQVYAAKKGCSDTLAVLLELSSDTDPNVFNEALTANQMNCVRLVLTTKYILLSLRADWFVWSNEFASRLLEGSVLKHSLLKYAQALELLEITQANETNVSKPLAMRTWDAIVGTLEDIPEIAKLKENQVLLGALKNDFECLMQAYRSMNKVHNPGRDVVFLRVMRRIALARKPGSLSQAVISNVDVYLRELNTDFYIAHPEGLSGQQLEKQTEMLLAIEAAYADKSITQQCRKQMEVLATQAPSKLTTLQKDEQFLQRVWDAVKEDQYFVLESLMENKKFDVNAVNPHHVEHEVSLDYGDEYDLENMTEMKAGAPASVHKIYIQKADNGIEYQVDDNKAHRGIITWNELRLNEENHRLDYVLAHKKDMLPILLEIISQKGHANARQEPRKLYVKVNEKGQVVYRVKYQNKRAARDVVVPGRENLTQQQLAQKITELAPRILEEARLNAHIVSDEPLIHYVVRRGSALCLRSIIVYLEEQADKYQFNEREASKYKLKIVSKDPEEIKANTFYVMPRNGFLAYQCKESKGWIATQSLAPKSWPPEEKELAKLKMFILQAAAMLRFVKINRQLPPSSPLDCLSRPYNKLTPIQLAFEEGSYSCLSILWQNPTSKQSLVHHVKQRIAEFDPDKPSAQKLIKYFSSGTVGLNYPNLVIRSSETNFTVVPSQEKFFQYLLVKTSPHLEARLKLWKAAMSDTDEQLKFTVSDLDDTNVNNESLKVVAAQRGSVKFLKQIAGYYWLNSMDYLAIEKCRDLRVVLWTLCTRVAQDPKYVACLKLFMGIRFDFIQDFIDSLSPENMDLIKNLNELIKQKIFGVCYYSGDHNQFIVRVSVPGTTGYLSEANKYVASMPALKVIHADLLQRAKRLEYITSKNVQTLQDEIKNFDDKTLYLLKEAALNQLNSECLRVIVKAYAERKQEHTLQCDPDRLRPLFCGNINEVTRQKSFECFKVFCDEPTLLKSCQQTLIYILTPIVPYQLAIEHMIKQKFITAKLDFPRVKIYVRECFLVATNCDSELTIFFKLSQQIDEIRRDIQKLTQVGIGSAFNVLRSDGVRPEAVLVVKEDPVFINKMIRHIQELKDENDRNAALVDIFEIPASRLGQLATDEMRNKLRNLYDLGIAQRKAKALLQSDKKDDVSPSGGRQQPLPLPREDSDFMVGKEFAQFRDSGSSRMFGSGKVKPGSIASHRLGVSPKSPSSP